MAPPGSPKSDRQESGQDIYYFFRFCKNLVVQKPYLFTAFRANFYVQLLLYSVLSYWRYLSCHSSIIRKMLSLNYLEISHGVNRSFRFFCSLNCDIFIIYLLKICSFLRKKKSHPFYFFVSLEMFSVSFVC